MIKQWKKTRGYKRHAGAIVLALTVIVPMFGVEIDPQILTLVKIIGTLIFGTGWLDAGAQALESRRI